MYLTDLRIEKETYGPNKGLYEGKATFANELGQVTLRLSNEHIQQIFSVCSEAIIATSKQAASELTVNIIEHKKAIEDVK